MGFYQDKRIVITGATGLLGVHLVSGFLDAGATVRAVVHRRAFPLKAPRIEIIPADMTKETDCDQVMKDADIACLCASVTARETTGFQVEISLEEGLSDTIDWFRSSGQQLLHNS